MNKYNIGDKVKAKINYLNDSRKEVNAIIIGVEWDREKNTIKYKIEFSPDKKDSDLCTGCEGYIKEDSIIGLC